MIVIDTFADTKRSKISLSFDCLLIKAMFMTKTISALAHTKKYVCVCGGGCGGGAGGKKTWIVKYVQSFT